jgi:hypothetical protein
MHIKVQTQVEDLGLHKTYSGLCDTNCVGPVAHAFCLNYNFSIWRLLVNNDNEGKPG